MKTIEIKKAIWSVLMHEIGRTDKNLVYLELSSNGYEIWLKVKPSYHWPHERKPLSMEKYPFLSEIHREVLTFDSRGKQFTINKDKVYLAENLTNVCKIKIVD